MSPVLIFKTKYLDDHRLYCQVSSHCGAWKNRVDCCIIGNMINSFMASKYHLKTRNQPEIKNPFKIKSVFLCNFKVKKTLMLAPLVKKEQFGLIRAKKKKRKMGEQNGTVNSLFTVPCEGIYNAFCTMNPPRVSVF